MPLIFHFSPQKPESNEQRQNGLKMVDQAIWSKKMSNGTRRIPVSPEQVQSSLFLQIHSVTAVLSISAIHDFIMQTKDEISLKKEENHS